jgi:hypothetical protein
MLNFRYSSLVFFFFFRLLLLYSLDLTLEVKVSFPSRQWVYSEKLTDGERFATEHKCDQWVVAEAKKTGEVRW